MYLYLKQQNQQQFLVPCYDIDLVWHTHQVNTLHYSNDTTAILGFVLKHDDSVNDRWVDIIFEFKKNNNYFLIPCPHFLSNILFVYNVHGPSPLPKSNNTWIYNTVYIIFHNKYVDKKACLSRFHEYTYGR